MQAGHFSPRQREGVVICGAYGMDNAGDDAVLEAVTAGLRLRERDLALTVIARHPRAVERRFSVRAIHPLRVLRWGAALAGARLFLSGGGTLLQDITSRRSLTWYLLTIRLARRLGCAVQLYGCGIGPLRQASSRRRVAEVLNACADVITLRDPDSAVLLESLGVTRPRILLAADPALSLPPGKAERERAAGFALRDWRGFAERVPALVEGARYVWEKYRREPVFFCLAPEDRGPARSLCRRLRREGVPASICVDNRRLGRMSLILSMRLHGLIFALRDSVPAAGVSYDPKVESFCRDAGLPWLPLEALEREGLFRLIDEAAHLDAESLSAAAIRLRERERVNLRAAMQLLADADNPVIAGEEEP